MTAVHGANGSIAIIGALGLWLVEGSYLPQLWRLYRMKEAEEFSLMFSGLNLVGRLAGFAYALTVGQAVFGWFFLVGASLRGVLLFQVFYYRARKRRIDRDRSEMVSI